MTRTQCIPERMEFQRLGCRDVTAAPDGGESTSDAGALLLREAEQRVNVALATGHPHIDVFHHAWRNLRARPEAEAAV